MSNLTQKQMLDSIGEMMAPFGISTLQIGKRRIALKHPKPLRVLKGHGHPVKIGDYVNIYRTHKGGMKLDAASARITWLESGSVGYEPAFQSPFCSNISVGLRGEDEISFQQITEEQGPRPTPEQVENWLAPKLLDQVFRTPTGRLNKVGKLVVAEVIKAFCTRKWGTYSIEFRLNNWWTIRKVVKDGKVVGFQARDYDGKLLV